MKKSISGNKKLVLPLILLVLVLVIGTSYALWQMTFRQTGTNIVTTGCFKVEFSDKNPITLGDAMPITDDDGKKLVPYEFTITNICSDYARYEVNLEVLNQTTLIEHSSIKTMLNENIPKILTKYEKVEKTLDNAVDSYNLTSGYLETDGSKTFNLRLWLDEDTPLSEDTMNKEFSSKVTVITSYAKKLPGTLRTISSSEKTGMWEYKSNITKLVIQNRLNKIANAIKVSDESVDQDESIMSYVVLNEDGETYTAYLQGQDVIYMNSNSDYLFRDYVKLESIEGIRYLDTGKVTRMVYIFSNCVSLTNLDLTCFNTTGVTTMQGMFIGCSSLKNIDLSNFDMSKVINMGSMFRDCSSLTTLDLDKFSTSNVTDMSLMFANCESLITLDLGSFDTSKVTDMHQMFSGCNDLVDLSLLSFNTSNVIYMYGMFSDCSSLTSLDLSNFDTNKVANMHSMFKKCRKLTSLDIGNFNTSKVTNMATMFSDCGSLTSLNLSGFDTSNVTDMGQMFYSCGNLMSLDLSGFNTVKVTDMSSMFHGCSNLTELDFSSFDTSNVITMANMFNSCERLTTITYGLNFIHKVDASIIGIFNICPANKPIDSSWDGVTY